MSGNKRQHVLVIGAGPVGALAALYAAGRGDEVDVYELRDGPYISTLFRIFLSVFREPIMFFQKRIVSGVVVSSDAYRLVLTFCSLSSPLPSHHNTIVVVNIDSRFEMHVSILWEGS